MVKIRGKLTVYFENPFWVAVFERIEDGMLSVSKVTFGAEPKDYDIYEFVLNHYNDLKFSPAVATVVKEEKKNHKRIQRELKKQAKEIGIGTKSQNALKLQQEQNKQERKSINRAKKIAEKDRRFELKQQKKKEKHKGH
ncbi:DUF2992 domain-containing protein [Streptococcus anginosus]|uniref:YjdF family protein n=1 Tax=Streptococcus anginosus TaxID=1328 RepID=UPI000D0240B3|nr:YjdF family protein [Streptococcus anginosus]PRT78182.1 DUF2992 domain-containing protein [Streptococcus anginosus]